MPYSRLISQSFVRSLRSAPLSRRYHSLHDSLSDVIPNNVDPTLPEFSENAQGMDALVQELDDLFVNHIKPGGSEKARKKHVEKGKLLPRQRLFRFPSPSRDSAAHHFRDRIETLLDPQSPWLELSPFAGHDMYQGGLPAGGVITGIGRVSGSVYNVSISIAVLLTFMYTALNASL
jgi:3-methylcrotonyl-CoA carboxylase beta subunit